MPARAFLVRPATMRSSTSVSQASGSTSFSFADWISVATIAQCLPAAIGAGEQRVLAPESDRAHGAFDGVGVQLQAAVIKIQDQPVPVVQGVADRLGQCGTAGDTLELFGQPGVHRLDQRPAALLAYRVGGARRAGHGSRPRSHRVRQSGAGLPRRAAIGWRRGCRRTCAAHGPSRKRAAGHRPACRRPGRQTRHSHRPGAGRGTPADASAGCSPLRSSL